MPFKSLCLDASGNYFNYQNSHVEDLLVQGIQERDEAKRKEIYKEIQNILAEQVPAVFTNHLLLSGCQQKGSKFKYLSY